MPDRQEFEHIGPEDASIPPFIVQVGDTAKSTSALVLVTQETFVQVYDMVRHAGEKRQRSPRPMGTFRVSAFLSGKPVAAITIQPEAMRAVITVIREMFLERNQSTPDGLQILETLLQTGERTSR